MSKRHQSLLSILSLIGVVLSVVALYEHVAVNSGLDLGKSFCNINADFNCDLVNQSKWSALFGFPIAGYGIAFYLFLFAFAQLARSDRFVSDRTFSGIFTLYSTAAVALSLVLFYISEVLVGSLCLVCLGMYLVNIGLFLAAFKIPSKNNFLDRIGHGVSGTINGLFSALSNDPEKKALAYVGLVLLFVGFFAIRSLPDFLLMNYIIPTAQEKQFGEAATSSVDAWKGASATNLELQGGGALSVDYRIGDESRPIQLVEFSDYECPACRRLFEELGDIIKNLNLSDKVSITFKNFPLDNACNPYIHREFHKHACFSAQFARCAGEQGKFWEATDFLFTSESLEEKLDAQIVRDRFYKEAPVLGLDAEAIKSCVDSGRHLEKIRSDIEQGTRLGVEGTPSVWVNGRKVEMPAKQVLIDIFKSIVRP